jgi:hypothetical protein
VRRRAPENRGLVLEAERRGIHNELASLKREIENKRAKLEQRRELAAVTDALSRTYDKKKPYQRLALLGALHEVEARSIGKKVALSCAG